MSFGGRGGGGFQRNLPFGLDYSDITNGTIENEKPVSIINTARI